MNILFPQHQIEVVREVDVVVAGGGPSGFAAALASARSGATTLLIERYGFLGGVGTNSLVAGFASGFHDGERLIIGGIYQQLREALYLKGALLKTDNYEPFDPDALAFYYMKTLIDAGVELRLHTLVTDVVMQGDRLEAIIVESKSGRQAIRAKAFVDATGDGDVSARAGVSYEIGRPRDGLMQPVSLMFALGGVNADQLVKEVEPIEGAPFNRHISGMNHMIFESQEERVTKAKLEGYLFNVPRKDIAIGWTLPGRPDVVYLNMARIQQVNGTNVEDLTRAEIEGRYQVEEALRFFRDCMPGFKNSYLQRVACQAGVRESRRIKGAYTLTEQDVLGLKQFDDVVAQAHYMIDIHDPQGNGTHIVHLNKGTSYDIPYRCLLPDKVSNLLVAGRCISATHEAFSSLRVMSISIALGEAAGTAAALSVKLRLAPGELSVATLQNDLLAHGAILH
ncbi:FAD-dependent oxidoreductase [Paenibacillus sp. LMG 31456]|uniref:FAD-dependent oxidoreductase n=1 Tax=Paenibacillus foliorum TaxID=2654974 RepID=A0A972GQ21_9BACL|nr:FAD-dependent oxidoreductase [Paenibacillus foliorum]NOU91727.1 FAD-dependent oxidoreductase [Paenibacillus foliorum]